MNKSLANLLVSDWWEPKQLHFQKRPLFLIVSLGTGEKELSLMATEQRASLEKLKEAALSREQKTLDDLRREYENDNK